MIFTLQNPQYRHKNIQNPLCFADYFHRDQVRKNGEPYIVHPIAVMNHVKKLELSEACEKAAVLHDVYEESNVTEFHLKSVFGKKVHYFVYCLTKDSKEYFSQDENGHQQRLFRYLEKLEKGIRKEPEIVFIKLCDQLDNLRTICIFPRSKVSRILKELHEYYIPLYKRIYKHIPEHLMGKFNQLFKELSEKVESLLQHDI